MANGKYCKKRYQKYNKKKCSCLNTMRRPASYSQYLKDKK